MFKNLMLKIYCFLKVFGKIIVYAWAGFTFLLVLMMIIIGQDSLGDCLDDGGWWDDDYKTCRFDHPGESDEELEEYVNGYCQGDGKGLHRCKMAAIELSQRKEWQKMKGIK